ncbi:MAG TPA: hypothetical protein VFV70_08795 [Hyphomonadaceae bacterium]|nr:hypothetical protein [Hyphomonadaceae bacterium]
MSMMASMREMAAAHAAAGQNSLGLRVSMASPSLAAPRRVEQLNAALRCDRQDVVDWLSKGKRAPGSAVFGGVSMMESEERRSARQLAGFPEVLEVLEDDHLRSFGAARAVVSSFEKYFKVLGRARWQDDSERLGFFAGGRLGHTLLLHC